MQIDRIADTLWRLKTTTGRIIAPHVRLRSDGTIRGHEHPNEKSWRLQGDAIAFYNDKSQASSILRPTARGGYEGPLYNDPNFVLSLEPTEVSYPFHLVWNNRCERVLAEIPIFVRHYRMTWGSFNDGQLIHVNQPIYAERDSSMPTGQLWSMGAHSYVDGHFDGAARVGRYCSIARGCGLMGDQHPTTWITTHHVAYQKRFETEARQLYGKEHVVVDYDPHPRLPIVVGHDVWIGQDVLFKGGITIGNGAIIAARAVVTRDVEPYAIVGGVPARIIRKRFTEEIVARIESLQWWRFNYPDLPRNWDRPVEFLDELERRIERGTIEQHSHAVVDLGAVLLDASLS